MAMVGADHIIRMEYFERLQPIQAAILEEEGVSQEAYAEWLHVRCAEIDAEQRAARAH